MSASIIPNVPNAHLARVSVLHRHGARGPSLGSFHPFVEESDAGVSKAPAAAQWREGEPEMLSSVGVSQMRELGRFFAQEYISGKRHANCLHQSFSTDSHRCKWRSSKVDRVVESGANFWLGFRGGPEPSDSDQTDGKGANVSKGSDSSEQQARNLTRSKTFNSPQKLWPYDGDADDWFRVWNKHPDFLSAWRAMKESEVFEKRAREHHGFLHGVLERLESHLAKQEDCLSAKLNVMTYVWELIDCEMFYPVPRTAVTGALSVPEQETVEEHARWVWGQRFFKTGHGHAIGGRLLGEVVDGTAFAETDESQPCFSAYSCHDYTILALFAALGADEYDGRVLGYGATVVFETWVLPPVEGGKPMGVVRILLNSHPFEGNDRKPCEDMQWNPRILTFPHFDHKQKGYCSVERLQESLSARSRT